MSKGYEDQIVWDFNVSFPKLRLGNLDAYRDWGHAQDYVKAMYLMLQEDPQDYVIATGKTHSVRDFLREAFHEIGIDNYEDYIVIDPKFYRPCEVEHLCGDSMFAQSSLGWTPQVSFSELVSRMVQSDINNAKEAKKGFSRKYRKVKKRFAGGRDYQDPQYKKWRDEVKRKGQLSMSVARMLIPTSY
jgi:dTDP-D-glucose 4,6-dehydratase